jgi:hypothetical protein
MSRSRPRQPTPAPVKPVALPGEIVSRSFPASGEALRDARKLLDGWSERLEPDLFQTARLLVSVLMALSIRRAPPESGEHVNLRVEVRDGHLRFEVAAARGFSFAAYDEDESADWGLQLVDELSDRWGMARVAGQTVCWLELDC